VGLAFVGLAFVGLAFVGLAFVGLAFVGWGDRLIGREPRKAAKKPGNSGKTQETRFCQKTGFPISGH
jgi:hypothetical protein